MKKPITDKQVEQKESMSNELEQIEKEWQDDRKKYTNPFVIRGYLKSAEKYRKAMTKIYFKKLTEKNK